ncbi:5-nucleotidase SurE [hydrothermal vent metagenome]|uniref:5'-nucleotidase n=1 Tax=hydrothermal vent metagenome TaxID=652676 RepID=A0A1W1CTJ6_9ZZZZ
MKILISNDDGVFSKGIQTLINTLKDFGDIWVVAPNENKSAASSSLSVQKDIYIKEISPQIYSVAGTPSDCVHLALTGMLNVNFDLVITGINFGANLGDDVIYSGTVAGSIEGRFLGLPSIAISLASWEGKYFNTAAKVANILVGNLNKSQLNSSTILNVNVPDIPFEDLQGFEVTSLGSRHPSEKSIKISENIYRIGANGAEDNNSIGTDFYAIKENKVSITPLQIDLTKNNEINTLKSWINTF